MRAAACLATMAFALSAWAAAAPGLPEDWRDADYSTKEIRALTHAYARCVVKRASAKAGEAIARNADNSVLLRRYPMLMSPECLEREVVQTTAMRFTGDLYRYALADALVNRELAAQPAPNLESVPRLDHRDPGPAPQAVTAAGRKMGKRKLEAATKAYERDATYAFLSHYGECVVRVDAAGAKALLLTAPDSSEETARFNALRPAFAHCLPEGKTLSFGKVTLRGSVAINYYRLALAARTFGGGAQ